MPLEEHESSGAMESSRADDRTAASEDSSPETVESASTDDGARVMEVAGSPADASSNAGASTDVQAGQPGADRDGASDVGVVTADISPPATTAAPQEPPNWDREVSAHKLIVELKRVEAEVRQILEERDSKRKRGLAGTRRWLELEEDLVMWRYSGRFDEPTLERLGRLIARRHYLFRRLRFLAGTRAGWNT